MTDLYNASKITTLEYACLLVNISIEANSVDQDQTAPDLDLHCLSNSLQTISARHKSIRIFVLHVYTLNVNKCKFSVYMVTIFMKCTYVCAAQTAY